MTMKSFIGCLTLWLGFCLPASAELREAVYLEQCPRACLERIRVKRGPKEMPAKAISVLQAGDQLGLRQGDSGKLEIKLVYRQGANAFQVIPATLSHPGLYDYTVQPLSSTKQSVGLNTLIDILNWDDLPEQAQTKGVTNLSSSIRHLCPSAGQIIPETLRQLWLPNANRLTILESDGRPIKTLEPDQGGRFTLPEHLLHAGQSIQFQWDEQKAIPVQVVALKRIPFQEEKEPVWRALLLSRYQDKTKGGWPYRLYAYQMLGMRAADSPLAGRYQAMMESGYDLEDGNDE